MIAAIMKLVVDLCNNNKTTSNIGKGVGDTIKVEYIIMIEDLSIKALYTMIEHHKLHM